MKNGNNKMTTKDLEEQCEQIQQDLLCILDGLDGKVLVNVCQVVVDRVEILKGKL